MELSRKIVESGSEFGEEPEQSQFAAGTELKLRR